MKQIDEVEVLNVLKRYIDKKIDRESNYITSAFIYCDDLVKFSTLLAWPKLYV